VWQILYPALDAADNLINCKALIKWLQVVSTSVAVANGMTPSAVILDLQAPLVDHALVSHRGNLLKQVHPALQQPVDSLEAALAQMAAAVLDNRVGRDEKRAREQAPKLPSDCYTSILNILLEFLQIPDEWNLPLLWHQWANATKHQGFQVLSEALHAYMHSPKAFNNCVLVNTTKLVQDLKAFLFMGDSTDDLKPGLQPFIIADGSVEHRQANLEISCHPVCMPC
jgi:hypothetical protein